MFITTTLDAAINQFWTLVSGALFLNPKTFTNINNLPLGLIANILGNSC